MPKRRKTLPLDNKEVSLCSEFLEEETEQAQEILDNYKEKEVTSKNNLDLYDH